MPSEKRGTVTEDFAGYMRRLKGSVEWKGDQNGTVRTAVAKVRKNIKERAVSDF
jgi:large subunit ribosomal protein L1